MNEVSKKRCFMFPGQGAQDSTMLSAIQAHPHFKLRYQTICDLSKTDPIKLAARDASVLQQNSINSLLTVLGSTLALDSYYEAEQQKPDFLAGYSVGQWTALYASGAIDFYALINLICKRAQLMDDCLAGVASSMLAVIGIETRTIEQICCELRTKDKFIVISNYNCPGQVTLSGTTEAIQAAVKQLVPLKPKRWVTLPVSGAWHCELLKPAADKFYGYLQSITVNDFATPIIDNANAKLLINNFKVQLAEHLYKPVLWSESIEQLIRLGCNEFIELGYGNTLTKFGFFINRQVHFHAYGLGPLCAASPVS